MEAAEIVVTPEEQSPDESKAIRQTESQVREYLQVLQGDQERRPTPPKLVFEDGRQVELSPRVLRALHFVAHHMAVGDAVALIPENKMLTTNEAAKLLNVSRPYLRQLLDNADIPYTMIGAHHRVLLSNVLEYKKRRDQQMYRTLDILAREGQEAGDYFDD
jgi:excisionase family DNA binding protein